MDLQNTFYVVGIIAMTFYTLLLGVVVVILFIIKRKITKVTQDVERKVNEVKNMADVGAQVADSAISKAASFINSRKNKSSS